MERARLVHAEKLFEIAHQGFETLYGESGSVIERLKLTRQRLREGEKIDPSLSPFLQALETAVFKRRIPPLLSGPTGIKFISTPSARKRSNPGWMKSAS